MQEPAFRAGSIRLADGRRIAVSELGSRDGLPVLYLHGAIGTPLRPTPELLATVERLKLRWLAVQRPGFGGSSPDPGRSLLRFARDVDDLADGLGLGHLAVLGVSAGGPYALACAHALPDRVAAVTVCSSLSPGLPACRASFSPDDGHFFFRRRIEEIVGRLAAEARAGERAQLRAA
jgi:pimeloyl-ACP methyl ester carboxylesterase